MDGERGGVVQRALRSRAVLTVLLAAALAITAGHVHEHAAHGQAFGLAAAADGHVGPADGTPESGEHGQHHADGVQDAASRTASGLEAPHDHGGEDHDEAGVRPVQTAAPSAVDPSVGEGAAAPGRRTDDAPRARRTPVSERTVLRT